VRKEELERLKKKYKVKRTKTTKPCVVPSRTCSPVKYLIKGVNFPICEKHLPDILDRLDRTDWISKVSVRKK
jgi:hypothetical protein